jgi:hypothetical protein
MVTLVFPGTHVICRSAEPSGGRIIRWAWNATRHTTEDHGAGRALHHFCAGPMEGPLQVAVSRRLPPQLSGPDPRDVTGSYRRATAQPSLSFEVVNEWLNRTSLASANARNR